LSLVIEYHPNTYNSEQCLSYLVDTTEITLEGKIQHKIISPKGETIVTVEIQKDLAIHQAFFVNSGGLVLGVKQNDQPWQFIVAGQSIILKGYQATFHGELKSHQSIPKASHTPQNVTDQAMILAAGFATRLEPISGELTGLCKPALPLGKGLSVIQTMVEHLISFGIKKVIVNTSFLPEPIHQQLQKYENQIEIKIIPEETPSGTAGGLLKAFELGYVDTTKPIIIVQGDAVSNFDLGHLLNQHQNKKASATIAGMRVKAEEVHRFGIIDTIQEDPNKLSGEIIGFLEKPTLSFAGDRRFANTGFYVLSEKVFDLFKQVGQKLFNENQSYDFANDFFPVVLNNSPTLLSYKPLFWAEELQGFWCDIGAATQYINVSLSSH
jgi:dTDP-glucose pyrophosphorylase